MVLHLTQKKRYFLDKKREHNQENRLALDIQNSNKDYF